VNLKQNILEFQDLMTVWDTFHVKVLMESAMHLAGRMIKVTITNDGFRLNNVEMEPRISEVLVVGDSFTFGDQVSNPETWPACLEKNLIGV
jgi:hypothetical protein